MRSSKVGHNNKGEEGSRALSLYSRIKAYGYSMCVCVHMGGWVGGWLGVVLGQTLTPAPLRRCTERVEEYQGGCRVRGRLLLLLPGNN